MKMKRRKAVQNESRDGRRSREDQMVAEYRRLRYPASGAWWVVRVRASRLAQSHGLTFIFVRLSCAETPCDLLRCLYLLPEAPTPACALLLPNIDKIGLSMKITHYSVVSWEIEAVSSHRCPGIRRRRVFVSMSSVRPFR